MTVHAMTCTQTNARGEQTWTCNDCDRVMVITSWSPFKRNVLVRGDETTQHTGSTSPALVMGSVAIISIKD